MSRDIWIMKILNEFLQWMECRIILKIITECGCEGNNINYTDTDTRDRISWKPCIKVEIIIILRLINVFQ